MQECKAAKKGWGVVQGVPMVGDVPRAPVRLFRAPVPFRGLREAWRLRPVGAPRGCVPCARPHRRPCSFASRCGGGGGAECRPLLLCRPRVALGGDGNGGEWNCGGRRTSRRVLCALSVRGRRGRRPPRRTRGVRQRRRLPAGGASDEVQQRGYAEAVLDEQGDVGVLLLRALLQPQYGFALPDVGHCEGECG